eukprot:NODE_137_length_16306_cov_0.462640.p7 type:complete len:286 gc:universal NODE_137_length_16306_cov_0.462640:14900-14043(-)
MATFFIYDYNTDIKVTDYIKNKDNVLMDVIHQSIVEMTELKNPKNDLNDGLTYAKHIFSIGLDIQTKNQPTTEYMEFHVDAKNHTLMKSGVFLKIVLNKSEDTFHVKVVVKKIISNDPVGYSMSVSENCDRNSVIGKVITVVKQKKLCFYPMIVFRRQMDDGDVHIDIVTCILKDGTRYSVQSIKSTSKDALFLFLKKRFYDVVNSKLYHLLWKFDNFLDISKCATNQSSVVLRSKLLRFITSPDKFTTLDKVYNNLSEDEKIVYTKNVEDIYSQVEDFKENQNY